MQSSLEYSVYLDKVVISPYQEFSLFTYETISEKFYKIVPQIKHGQWEIYNPTKGSWNILAQPLADFPYFSGVQKLRIISEISSPLVTKISFNIYDQNLSLVGTSPEYDIWVLNKDFWIERKSLTYPQNSIQTLESTVSILQSPAGEFAKSKILGTAITEQNFYVFSFSLLIVLFTFLFLKKGRQKGL